MLLLGKWGSGSMLHCLDPQWALSSEAPTRLKGELHTVWGEVERKPPMTS